MEESQCRAQEENELAGDNTVRTGLHEAVEKHYEERG